MMAVQPIITNHQEREDLVDTIQSKGQASKSFGFLKDI